MSEYSPKITRRPSERSRCLENNKINEKKKLKRATVGSSQEIWCSNQETGRFDEKLGDSRENRESWQVCKYFRSNSLCHEDK